jgi:hypothetical protein
MTKRAPHTERMQAFSLMPGMHLHIADFIPPGTIEQKFETTNPVLRSYFYSAPAKCMIWSATIATTRMQR